MPSLEAVSQLRTYFAAVHAVAQHEGNVEKVTQVRTMRATLESLIDNQAPDLSRITRVTVVGSQGRLFENYHAFDAGTELNVQDEGRTLKLFPMKRTTD